MVGVVELVVLRDGRRPAGPQVAPESTKGCRDSAISGMPRSAVDFSILWVAIAVMPGSPPRALGGQVRGSVLEHRESESASTSPGNAFFCLPGQWVPWVCGYSGVIP